MDHEHPAPPFLRSRHFIGLLIIGMAAAWFLLTEHRAHILGALPYLLLLACPLMHLFMHHGHGDHGDNQGGHDGHGCHGHNSKATQPPHGGKDGP